MNLRKSLVGGLGLSIAPLILNAINLPVLAFIIRQLGPTAYGQWITASVLVASCAMLASLGLRGSFIHLIASGTDDISNALAEQLGTRLLLSAIASALGFVTAMLLGHPPIVLVCVAICAAAMLINSAASTLLDVLLATHRTVSTVAISFVSGLVLTAASVVVAYNGGGPIVLALTYLAGPILTLILACMATSGFCEVRICLSLRRAKAILCRSRGFAAQQLLNSAPAHVESILLPRLLGTTHFGFFNAGSLLGTRLAVVPDGLCTAAYPVMSREFASNRRHGILLSLRFGAIICAACLLIAIVAAALSGPFSRLLFPEQPQLCQIVLLLTIWALPLTAIDSVLGYALNAAGADAAQARASLPAAICNVVLLLLLISQLGIVGACIALPLRSVVRIILLGTCCLRLGRSARLSNSSTIPFVPGTAHA